MREREKAKEMALIGFLAAVIAISGMIRIPGVIPGTEFQLSAPVAVGAAAAFGFRRYLTAGIVASAVSLMLGLQNILNVMTAMTFRLGTGLLLLVFGNLFFVVIAAGPLGTVCARLVLSLIAGTPVWVLLLAALPGMIYTAVTAVPAHCLYRMLARRSGFQSVLVPRRFLKWEIRMKNRKRGRYLRDETV